jgi:hypothetical protein
MRRDLLLKATQARPFKPFRLYTTDGGDYLIRHPELCLVGANDVFVFLNFSAETEPAWEDFAVIDLSHVSKWEVTKDSAAPAQPGESPA